MNQPVRPLVPMDTADVQSAYRRWAPVYDRTFGKIVDSAVRQVTARANQFSGKLLEVGVGTGLALPHYAPDLRVTGIDLSPHMLERARERMTERQHHNVEALLEMDATALDFPAANFDLTVAMFVMTVVPDPVQVMHELARVTKPGGAVLICNHFSVEGGIRGALERRLAKFATHVGWRPEFPATTIMVSKHLKLINTTPVKPFGFFTLLEFHKKAGAFALPGWTSYSPLQS